MNPKVIEDKFKQLFGTPDFIVRSPGRVNLIGEHTDYNGGFVLPASIDKDIVLAVARNDTSKIRLFSVDFKEVEEICIEEGYQSSKNEWANYIIGVLDQLDKAGLQLGGFDCVFGGDIPVGSGLSSSAALECGVGFAMNQMFDLKLDKFQIVKHAQKAENEFVGVKCGIMDQFANMFGNADHVIKLDCRSLEYEYYPLEMEGYKIVLFDTQVKHSLASSAYNERREECEAGVKAIKKLFPEVNSLRDCTLEMVEACLKPMEGKVYDRCQYVVQENERVETACNDLKQGYLKEFGKKMYASHDGLRHKYEVSCKELDVLVDITRDMDDVLGARMMGGGFGGCTINLVKEEGVAQLAEEVNQRYKDELSKEIKVYFTEIKEGTNLL